MKKFYSSKLSQSIFALFATYVCCVQTSDNQKTSYLNEISGHFRLGGYYPVYNAQLQPPSAINYKRYTDLYFFVATTTSTFEIGTGNITQDNWDVLAHDFVSRCKKANVNPHYTIGGWTGSIYFSSLVANAENRTKFATSMVNFAHKFGFVGINIDWEYPSAQGIGCNIVSADDTKNFGLFVKELKRIWPQGILSIAAPVTGFKEGKTATLAPASSLTDIQKNIDFLNVMTYDIFGGWSTTTGPLGPLYATCAEEADAISVETGGKLYRSLGFTDNQIQIGIPAYARSYTLTSPGLVPKTIAGQISYAYQNKSKIIPPGGRTDDKPGTDICGNKQNWGGQWTVSELVKAGILSSDGRRGGKGYQRIFDECSKTPFLVNGTTFFAYDDQQSTFLKSRYVRQNKYGGIFFFATDGPMDETLRVARKALKMHH